MPELVLRVYILPEKVVLQHPARLSILQKSPITGIFLLYCNEFLEHNTNCSIPKSRESQRDILPKVFIILLFSSFNTVIIAFE